MRRLFFWGLGLWCTMQVSAWAGALQAIEMQKQAGRSALVFSLQGSGNYHAFTLSNPDRIAIDFKNTSLAMYVQRLHLDPQVIRLVRSGTPFPGTLRIVFELTRPYDIRTESLYHGVRINLIPIPLKTVVMEEKAHTKTPPIDVQPIEEQQATPIMVKHVPAHSSRPVRVVIDPGHGGRDPGARGPMGTSEKDVVLAIAKRLQAMINVQPGMTAILTRHGDEYLSLRERLRTARHEHADVFISIHADAFRHRRSIGASVFALSQRGATSEAAKWLAEKENNSELGGVNLSALDDKNGLVRTVLLDLSQTATVGASLQMGTHVLKELGEMTSLHALHVEQARFVVLKSPDIPSILIETGFISNPSEELHLRGAAYQARLAEAVVSGLKHYFWEHPPPGTWIERQVARRGRA